MEDGIGHCGETCIKSYDFGKLKIFEKTLVKGGSLSESSCADHGYAEYYQTVTPGVPHLLSITLDLYDVPKATDDDIV